MLAKSQACCDDGTPFSLLSRNSPLLHSLYPKSQVYFAVSMNLLANAAQAAKTHVPLMPQNVVHLDAPLHVMVDAVIPVSVPYAFSNDTSLKTAFR
jgi:hypothetical protein